VALRQQAEPGGEEAEQHQGAGLQDELVVGAEGVDRPLPHRRRSEVDDRLAHRRDRAGLRPYADRRHQLRHGKPGGRGEQAAERGERLARREVLPVGAHPAIRRHRTRSR
jgi:hypothetical protein